MISILKYTRIVDRRRFTLPVFDHKPISIGEIPIEPHKIFRTDAVLVQKISLVSRKYALYLAAIQDMLV